jgi:hypothetical protein
MSIAKTGVYWPFKNLLQGAGINLVETADSIQIIATGGGTGGGGGDMLQSEYAPSGISGKVDHAILADNATNTNFATTAGSVAWGGITGLPTNFPTDWTYIANKPSAFPPLQHRATHVTGGSDIIVSAGPATSGLLNSVSGLVTDYVGGDNACHDLNTQVGMNPLNMHALFTAFAGSNFQGGITQLTDTRFQIANPNGKLCGVYNTGGHGTFWALASGGALNLDAASLYKPSGYTELYVYYQDGNGNGVYSAPLVNTWCPGGSYVFRNGARLIGQCGLNGDANAVYEAAFLVQTAAGGDGGFTGYGMVSYGHWGCALGTYGLGGGGLWIATTSNTFVQLSDSSGHIIGSALASGAVSANLGYRPVSSGGDTMVGDLWVNKAGAQILAYQDANNYCRLQGGPDANGNYAGLSVYGNNRAANGYGGMIFLRNTAADNRAGITFQTSGGRIAQLYLDADGGLRWTDYNTNQTFTVALV